MHQRNRPSSPFFIGIVVAIFFTGESLAQEEIDWKGRFFAEAPKRWEDYLRFARSVQITVTSNVYNGPDRSLKRSLRLQYKQTKGAFLRVVEQRIGPKSEVEAKGANPKYSFKLSQSGPDRGWIITHLELPDQSTIAMDEQRKLQEEYLQETVCSCLRLEAMWLPMLIHDPDFKIAEIKSQEIDGVPVVRFDFDYPKPDGDYPRKGALRIKGGWMILDPEHDWILRDYQVHSSQPECIIRKTFQIREGTDRHPIITHFTQQLFFKGARQFEKGEAVEGQWQAEERSDVPLAEFTLSAFGLSEPPGIQVERSRWYLWIALAGAVCLGIAGLIRWRLRRARG